MILWITGLSAAGKTSIGREVFKLWRALEPNTVFIDGDEIRHLFKQDKSSKDYSVRSRRISSERMVSLCEWLDRQNINAISCNIGMFSDIRKENRKKYKNYYEVYVDASMDTIRRRDSKNIYSSFDAGKTKNVVGLDIPFQNYQTQDITINNDGPHELIRELAKNILQNMLENSSKLDLLNNIKNDKAHL